MAESHREASSSWVLAQMKGSHQKANTQVIKEKLKETILKILPRFQQLSVKEKLRIETFHLYS